MHPLKNLQLGQFLQAFKLQMASFKAGLYNYAMNDHDTIEYTV